MTEWNDVFPTDRRIASTAISTPRFVLDDVVEGRDVEPSELSGEPFR